MDARLFSTPLPLSAVKITDPFWQHEMELVRTEVIPYQWEALNDRVPDASPSWCMHNFRAAARLIAQRKLKGDTVHYAFPVRGFEELPDDPANPNPDHFYGFVFQDSDFSKWIEAVGYSLTTHPDAALEAIADGAIDVVCAAQEDDGYLDTRFILGKTADRFTNVKDLHELYCLGHLIEAAVAYYQATGKDKLLQAACRYADCVDAHFGPEEGKLHGYPGHEIAEMALMRLYEVTHEERYLKLARYFVDERGKSPNFFQEEYLRRLDAEQSPVSLRDRQKVLDVAYNQAHIPVRNQDEAVGHAVRAMYLYSGMADVARSTQDDTLYEACERLWNSTVQQKMYITGGVGSTVEGEAFSYPYDLPNDTAYSETCAAIGLVFFARRMLQIHADSRYGDVMELALYNTVLDGMALDGKSFFYVNPLEVNPVATATDKRLQHVKIVRQKWFGCACCPPNIARLVSSLGAYACTANESTLFVHLYVSGEINTTLNGQSVVLNCESGMPWQGKAAYTVHTGAPVNGTIAFRLPGWCRKPVIIAEGKQMTVRDGYCYVSGLWQDGDQIAVELPMHVRVMKADLRVRENAGQVAFACGPIVYCGEQADNGTALHLIHVDPTEASHSASCSTSSVFGFPVTVLDVPVQRLRQQENGLYSEWTPDTCEPAMLHLIPYFCWANRGEGEMRVWWH